MTRFGLDDSQKKRPFASSPMIAENAGPLPSTEIPWAANAHSPVREKRDDAPTVPDKKSARREESTGSLPLAL